MHLQSKLLGVCLCVPDTASPACPPVAPRHPTLEINPVGPLSMADQRHTTTVFVASVAAVASSLLSLAAAAYLLPLRQQRGSSHSQRWAVQTPEPSSSSSGQPPGALFSPVNKQKRPDPYDPRPRNT